MFSDVEARSGRRPGDRSWPAARRAAAAAQDLRPDQVRFREIYKELVETNTSLSAGSCTVAAAKMGARLKSAGFTDADLTYFSVPDHPKEGGLVAISPGIAARPPSRCCCWATSTWSRPSAPTGPAIPSVSSRRTASTTAAATSDMKVDRRHLGRHADALQGASTTSPSAPSSWRSPAARRPWRPSTAPTGWPRTGAT